MPVTEMVTGSPSGSVTPSTPTDTDLWFGGQSSATLASAPVHTGGRFSIWQSAEHPSPLTRLPSSQVSGGDSSTPSPQTARALAGMAAATSSAMAETVVHLVRKVFMVPPFA